MASRLRHHRQMNAPSARGIFAALLAAAAPLPQGRAEPIRWESNLPLEKITFSAQIRQRFELQGDYDHLHDVPDDNDFVGSRIRMGFDIAATDRVGAFLQAQDSRNWGGNPTTSTGNQVSRLEGFDLHQGYARFALDRTWSARLGRQELAFGTEKLVSPLGWSNVGRAFDAARVTHDGDLLKADLWASRLGESPTGTEDDISFHGLHATWKGIEGHPFDLYALWSLDQRRSRGEIPTEQMDTTDFWTTGAQYSQAKVPFGPGEADWGAEIDFQEGRRGTDELRAQALHGRVGYTWPDFPGAPRVGYHYDLATGDSDPADGREETFDQLHPLGHEYHGYIDFVGRRNLVAHRCQIGVTPHPDWWLGLDHHFFYLESAQDHLYAADGTVRRTNPATGGISKQVGAEADLTARYTVNRYWTLQAGYSYFDTGRFFGQTRTAATGQGDADLLYLQSTLSF